MHRLTTRALRRRPLCSARCETRKVSVAGKSAEAKTQKVGKYKGTVLLPQTKFPQRLKPADRVETDEYLIRKCRFPELYEWQRQNLRGPDFVLHDGPPYANGAPHMGHAINKILKDITLRHNIIRGRRVHYVPGWDCHGLPIEMKVANEVRTRDPLEIRRKARRYAEKALAVQRAEFEAWGVTADWRQSGCYFTNSAPYVKNQLTQFINLYEKGLIYRDFKPVYWSPSSRTALAESELEYNASHKSRSAFVRFRFETLPGKLQEFRDRKVFALIWTTTPWTLVANQAVAFSKNSTYALAEDLEGNLNLIAKDLLESVRSKIGTLRTVAELGGDELSNCTYLHPITKVSLPFLHGQHVTTDVGTGLVHTAPAHGPDDFLVALNHNLKVSTMVDESGCYTDEAGHDLCGLEVLTEGTDAVIERVSDDLLLVEEITHSYPYDWRTKKPVVIRASHQWFVDIESIKQQAVESIGDVKIYPETSRAASLNALLAQVTGRPYWCISRQRSWGTPIPVLYCKKTGKVLTNRKLIDRLGQAIDEFGPDCWWEHPVGRIIGSDVIEEFGLNPDDVEKGQDIMDIWFDSGTSWSSVLPDKKADLYLEGIDQFSGWFQSSLLTSIALQGTPPYRSIFVHGFAVDSKNTKMSKSTGNVISPNDIIKGGSKSLKSDAYGVDVLRLWVAKHGCQHSQVPVTNELFDACKSTINDIRLILRFLLGVLHPYSVDANVVPKYLTLDKHMLYLLYKYNETMQHNYDNYLYHHACSTLQNFISNDVSSLYCHLTKDRIYCDDVASPARMAALEVSREILTVLVRTIAPILPHLAEEVWLHYPNNLASVPLHFTEYQVPEIWNNSSTVESIDAARRCRDIVHQLAKEYTWRYEGTVRATKQDFVLLSHLQKEDRSIDSELCEILQLSSVNLIEDQEACETRLELRKVEIPLCDRCRRHVQVENGLCLRCANLLAKLNA